jgi:hypothetical protein
MLNRISKRWLDLQELIQPSEILVDSTMYLICAKIGMIQVIVPSETAAYICMIVQTIKVDGNLRNNFSKQKEKDGRE